MSAAIIGEETSEKIRVESMATNIDVVHIMYMLHGVSDGYYGVSDGVMDGWVG